MANIGTALPTTPTATAYAGGDPRSRITVDRNSGTGQGVIGGTAITDPATAVRGPEVASFDPRSRDAQAQAVVPPVQEGSAAVNAAAPVARGNLSQSTLKDLIFSAQGGTGSGANGAPPPPARADGGAAGSPSGPAPDPQAVPDSAIITRPGPDGAAATILASVSTNVDGSGRSITLFAEGGVAQTYNFAADTAASGSGISRLDGLPAPLSTRAEERGSAFVARRINIAA